MLGIRTRDCGMGGGDESTELWRPNENLNFTQNRQKVRVTEGQCDQIGQFIGLWATF